MINQLLALTNKYVPLGFAMKGLGKIDPKFTNFFESALASGYTADAAMDYLRGKLSTESQRSERDRLEQGSSQGTLRPDEKASLQTVKESERIPDLIQKAASVGIGAATGGLAGGAASALGSATNQGEQQAENVISKFSPELGSLLDQVFNAGHNIDEAIGIVTSPNYKYTPIIAQIEKTLKMPFDEILRSVYGGEKRKSVSPQSQGHGMGSQRQEQGSQQRSPQYGAKLQLVTDLLAQRMKK